MTQRLPSTKADWLKVVFYYMGATTAYAVLAIPLFQHMAIPSHYSTPKAISVYIIVVSLWFSAFFLTGLVFSVFITLVGKKLKMEKWANIFRRGVFIGFIFAAVLAAGSWYSYASGVV